MKQPLVSVIIPYYNAAQYVADTLKSVAAQSYTNVEVVICDDGSTSEQSEALAQIASQYANVTVFKAANGGQSAARNRAIERAQGKYILPLDADDLIAPTYIERAVEVLEADDNMKIVYCRGEFFGDKTGSMGDRRFEIGHFAQSNLIHAASLFRRDDWLRTEGYLTGLLFWEDWDFWISILETGGSAYQLDEVLFFYRVRGDGMRKSADKQRKTDALATLNERHAPFFKRYLGGPLRSNRSWSRFINLFCK